MPVLLASQAKCKRRPVERRLYIFETASGLNRYRLRQIPELGDLVEIHITVNFSRLGVYDLHLLHVFGDGWDSAEQRTDGRQFGGAEVAEGLDTKTVGEVARRGREDRGALSYSKRCARCSPCQRLIALFPRQAQ